ncbi:PP2C family serine/threonine-protein phosphatase [Nocardioides sp. cx-173]|uniref:PP2C family protein-serine/threonine phosphatase n=1 Tax=Nocardioides sp. cx-173 TaxID=2898796 RepID=UPI001E50A174|nr:protein phosphatase 2C domain-containing protein [Nocardioides sp. cx-173]MCD4523682.1 protein phosphatase 2C domain-containing protein [Nocardioides sp. cx-173]UGB41988.1 protein phosphatase 2C domain-containing protein [Nocardioides sp. cx-173]
MTSSSLRLHYSAISDVGRVRKDNQDSGYAGPWLLAVCDGVGGAARGDIASATAISTLRELDQPPADDTGSTLLDRVAASLHEAHLRIGQLVDADPAIDGTSTTATVALFDGARVGMGHVGDSRAYLFRDRELSQLTKDHTFVQSLIDEGRITEAESRVHPHRNLILKALDGMQEADPDLFMIELVEGDRLLLCSDGASGVLDDGRLADILSMGTPDFAAVELVRASLEAGSSDNVTCLVADVVTDEAATADPSYEALEPLLVGAAAELRRRAPRGKAGGSLFRGHRAGDTGELDPIDEEIPGGSRPVDPEAARYAPIPPSRFQWLKRLLALVVVVGIVWVAVAAAYSWSQDQYFVGEHDGSVVIYRGVDTDLPGLDLYDLYQTSDVELDRLSEYDARRVREGIEVGDLEAARATVQNLSSEMTPADSTDSTDGAG